MGAVAPDEHHCFVSHSYQDAAALQACLGQRLPRRWQPYVFPRIEVSPDQAVSDRLVDAIGAAGGFVHLDTPISAASFWVGFERNMAARLGKRVYAFHPGARLFSFSRDRRPPVDPLISVLFNLGIQRDVETLAALRPIVWERYRFEFRGDGWRRLDNEPRQMFDSIDGMVRKFEAGGAALVFLSNDSVCSGHHDYADALSYHRAGKDFETPVGYAAEKFARLDPVRTLVAWLEAPDSARIKAALARFAPIWKPYVDIVRASLEDPHKLILFRNDGELDRNHLDTMIARCFWAARVADPDTAIAFREALTRRP